MASLVVPLCIFAIGFKSTEELLLMPQTLEEHMQDVEDADHYSITSSTSFIRLHNAKDEEEIAMVTRWFFFFFCGVIIDEMYGRM